MVAQTSEEASYIVVTPAYNEESNLPATVKSMTTQTTKPKIWVIVDDNSSDKTWNIITEAAQANRWIVGLRRDKHRDIDADGLLVASESKAFLEGYRLALDRFSDPDFVVKLDADLEFGPDYFGAILEEFRRNLRLGLAGGVIYEYHGSALVREKVSKAHVRGATKIYRSDCYRNIGGIAPIFGWDVIDEIQARAAGWEVRSFAHLRLVHLRRTASRGGRFTGYARNGYMAYYIGMSLFRIMVRVLSRLFVTGDIIQCSGLAYGYFSKWLKRAKRLPDPKIRRLVKKHQWITLRAYLKPGTKNDANERA